MKTILLVVGRTVEQHYITAINDYIQRTKRYITFDMEVIPELKNTKSLSMEVQKEKEGELILKSLQPVYQAANEKISMSKMTFSHQMIRLIFVEQIYRAMTILNGGPYHHE